MATIAISDNTRFFFLFFNYDLLSTTITILTVRVSFRATSSHQGRQIAGQVIESVLVFSFGIADELFIAFESCFFFVPPRCLPNAIRIWTTRAWKPEICPFDFGADF